MKKILVFATFLLSLLSCNNFHKEAERQMVNTLMENAKLADPDAEISDIKLVYNSDSLVIIHCSLHGPRNNGWKFDIEYLYLLQADGSRREMSYDINKEPSVIDRAEAYRKELKQRQGIIIDSIESIKKASSLVFTTR